MPPLQQFLLALSFLSRLAPAREADEFEMAASVKYFPLVGLVLGLIAALPLGLGLAAGKPLLQAVIYLLLSLWLTRALHWDGLADFFDALGSGKHGEEFTRVMKDSRIGVFGAVALAFCLLASLVGATYCLEYGRWTALIWVPLLSRSAILYLARRTTPASRPGLGGMMAAGASLPVLAVATGGSIVLGILLAGWIPTLVSCHLVGFSFAYIHRVAEREGGISGDYYGAAIVMAEGFALFATALVL